MMIPIISTGWLYVCKTLILLVNLLRIHAGWTLPSLEEWSVPKNVH